MEKREKEYAREGGRKKAKQTEREIERNCFKIYPEGEGEREWKKGIEILKEREEEETEKERDGQRKKDKFSLLN